MKKRYWCGLVLLCVCAGFWLSKKDTEHPAEPVVLAASQGQQVQHTSLVCRELVDCGGITALVLENTGTIGIQQTTIVVIRGGQRLYFETGFIPPECAVLIPEKTQVPYSGPEFESCYCLTMICKPLDQTE